jgi:hypothetical protein
MKRRTKSAREAQLCALERLLIIFQGKFGRLKHLTLVGAGILRFISQTGEVL